MKTLTKFLVAAALASAAVAYAGPGPQYWNRPANKAVSEKSQTRSATTEMAAPAASASLMCDRMWIPNNNPKQAPFHVVKCTPEMMMKNDWRCQQACAAAAKAKG